MRSTALRTGGGVKTNKEVDDNKGGAEHEDDHSKPQTSGEDNKRPSTPEVGEIATNNGTGPVDRTH